MTGGRVRVCKGIWPGVTVAAAVMAGAGPAWAGDKPLYQPAPAWITPAPLIDATKLGDDAPLVLRWDDQERLADGVVWSYRDIATRMATPDVVAQSGTLTVAWQPARGDLIVHALEILRGSERINVLAGGKTFTVIRREQQLERLAMDGELTATMAVEGLQVGDVLRLVVSTLNKDTALGGAVQDVMLLPTAPARMGFARTRLVWPTATPVKWRSLADGANAKVTSKGGETEMVIAGLLPKPAALPDDAPASARRLPLLEASSFTGWPAVSQVMAPYYATDGRGAENEPLAREVDAIKAANADPLKRADAALQLVQDKVRYLFNGMDKGNYVPQSPEQTWALRYGDCKAKTLLLLAMLHGLGIEAEPVLANTDLGGLTPQRLPSAAAFNHVLVRAAIGGRSYWLDGTGSGARFADLGDTPPFRWVLPIRKDGAELMPVPLQPPVRPTAAVSIDIDQRAGIRLPALVRTKVMVRGPTAAQIGLAKTQGGKEQVDAAVKQMVDATTGADMLLTRYTLTYDPRDATAVVDATGLMTTQWRWIDNRYRMAFDRSVANFTFEPDRARPAWKAIPVATGNPETTTISARIHLPGDGKGYAFDGDTALPAPLASTTIRRAVIQSGPLFGFDDVISTSGADVAPADVPAARARVALAKTRVLSITAPVDLPSRASAVREARAAGLFKPLLDAYAQAIADDPKEVAGYVSRASFLTGTFDWKAALPDLDQAIALEPSADLYLRRANLLLITSADTKALADLQSARALDPASTEAIETLSRYMTDHGDRDAALALVQERIDAGGEGKAGMIAVKASLLARVGDKDGAVAASDQAVAAKPGDPNLLNGRCWLKGQLGVQLDTALKDCTKSIELSDSTLAALDSRALVYFRLNRFGDALTDLNAVLEQAPDQAASLYLRGVIRARQGQKAASRQDIESATFIAPRVATEYAPFGIAP